MYREISGMLNMEYFKHLERCLKEAAPYAPPREKEFLNKNWKDFEALFLSCSKTNADALCALYDEGRKAAISCNDPLFHYCFPLDEDGIDLARQKEDPSSDAEEFRHKHKTERLKIFVALIIRKELYMISCNTGTPAFSDFSVLLEAAYSWICFELFHLLLEGTETRADSSYFLALAGTPGYWGAHAFSLDTVDLRQTEKNTKSDFFTEIFQVSRKNSWPERARSGLKILECVALGQWAIIELSSEKLPDATMDAMKISFQLSELFCKFKNNLPSEDAEIDKFIADLKAKAGKFTRTPNPLREEAKTLALAEKHKLISQGKSRLAANAIIQSKLENNPKYSELFKDYGVEDWKKFLQDFPNGKRR